MGNGGIEKDIVLIGILQKEGLSNATFLELHRMMEGLSEPVFEEPWPSARQWLRVMVARGGLSMDQLRLRGREEALWGG